jgi:PilZ domain-containing protein
VVGRGAPHMLQEFMRNQRQQFRLPIDRRGFVTQGEKTTLCEVLDLTELGLLFTTDLPLTLNDSVRIECQLDDHCLLQCEVLVTHASQSRFGGRITNLSPDGQQQLTQFIDRLIRASMEGL